MKLVHKSKNKKVKKVVKWQKGTAWTYPEAGDIIIERIIFTKDGHVDAVDLHDERFGEAVFCRATDRHYHGKLRKV